MTNRTTMPAILVENGFVTNSAEAVIRGGLVNNRENINQVCVLGSNKLISDNILYNLGISTIK